MGLVSMLLVAGCGDDSGNTPVDGGAQDGGYVGDAGMPMLVVHSPQDVVSSHDVHLHAEVMGGLGAYRMHWSQSSGTPVQLSDDTTSNPSFSAPHVTADEVLVFQVVAFDSLDQRVESSVTVNIAASALTVLAGDDLSKVDASRISLHGSATGDLDGVTYTWRQTAGTPGAAITDGHMANAFVDLPAVDQIRIFTFELKAVNGDGIEATDTVDVVVIPTQVLARAGNDTKIQLGGAVTLQGQALGGAGAATYAWAVTSTHTPPIVLVGADTDSPTFNTTGLVMARPPTEDIVIELTVTDAEGHPATDSVTVQVWDYLPPSLVMVPPVDIAVDEGGHVQLGALLLGGTQPYIVTWTQEHGTPVDLTPSPSDSTAVTFVAPAVTTEEVLLFHADAVDSPPAGAPNTAGPVTVHVIVSPKVLTVDAGVEITVEANHLVHLGARASDGHTPYTYAWVQTGGTTVSISSSTVMDPFITTSTPLAGEALTFEVTVTDSLMNTDTDTVIVNVQAVPDLMLSAKAPSEVPAGSVISLHARGRGGSGVTNYDFVWAQTGGTAGTWIGTQDRRFAKFQTPHVTLDEDLTFTVQLEDSATGAVPILQTVTVSLRAPDLAFTQSERTAHSCTGRSECATSAGQREICDGPSPVPIVAYGVKGGMLIYTFSGCESVSGCSHFQALQDPACATLDLSNPPADVALDCAYCCAGDNCNDSSALALPPADTLVDCSDAAMGCCNMESSPRCVGGTAAP